MACGCKKNQTAQKTTATPQTVNKSRPVTNGSRGVRTTKRIIR